MLKRNNQLFFVLVILVGMVTLILPNNSQAVESLAGKGKVSTSLSYSYIDIEDADDPVEVTNFLGEFGYFVTDHIEINFSPLVTSVDTGDSDSTIYSVFVNGKYNFYKRGWNSVPYAGLQAGITGVDTEGYDDSTFSFGGMAGFKQFLTESISFNLEGNYMYYEVENTDVNQFSLFLGFTWYFGG